MIPMKFNRSLSLLVIFALLLIGFVPAFADEPGTGERPVQAPQAPASQSLQSVVSEYGKITLSMDAMGTIASSGIIHVDKPNGSLVRKAYLLSATTGFTSYQLAPGDVKLNGIAVAWQNSVANSIESYNYWADISNMVKPIIDAAPAGIVDLTIEEANSLEIDGEILAVIFDNPAQTTDNTINLYFGAQNIAGDTFTINTGEPIDIDDPNLKLDFSLGISYGYQGTVQYSQVDVNGTRLTTSAGGQDDGDEYNGALITVGGIGDSNANPADPFAGPIDARSDDELYDLKPFVADNDQTIVINTINPSNDDNIFFAALFLGATAGVPSIDLDISLHNNPTSVTERAPYESIIRYFADGVFESSNGAHKLGRVTFHPNGAFANEADVVWVASCHPNANVAGFGTNGLHINMCDNFSASSYNFLSDDTHQRGGGYTLAHEFGHFYYSLYDEYVGQASYDSIFHFPHSTDVSVTNAIMNSQWSAVSGNNNWLNFSIPKNDTQQTAQYRVYAACGWDTLTRPVADDPRDGARAALPVRLFHAELANVEPAANQDSPIELPGTARSELEIIWSEPSMKTLGPNQTLSSTALPFSAQLVSILGQNISSPDPIVLLAFVHKDLNITGAGVHSIITLPDASILPLNFADDGIAPDRLAGDGWYSAMYNYDTNGLYEVQVSFENDSGEAMYVATAFQPSTGSDGNAVPLPEPTLVGENFLVSQSLYISVSNVALDDHGDLPAEATDISANNVPLSGKINADDASGSDVDVFAVQTLTDAITVIRVDNLAFGMVPSVRVLAADQTTVLYEADRTSTQCAAYLNIKMRNAPRGSTVYVEVSDQNQAEGGLYQFSAGNLIASDTGCELYLPSLLK